MGKDFGNRVAGSETTRSIEFDLEEAQQQLESLQSALSGWYSSREADSLAVQRVRSHAYYQDGEALRQLINDLTLSSIYKGDAHQLELTTGLTALRISEHSVRGGELAPGSKLTIKYHKIRPAEYADSASGRFPAEFYKPGDLFLGDSGSYISLDALAMCLHDQGRLEIVEVPAESNSHQ